MLDASKKILLIRKILENKKAFNILILDLRKITTITDFFIICNGNSDIHIRAIADEIYGKLKKKNELVWHIEGYQDGQWILMDYVDVVIHIFYPTIREYYALETIWGDAPTIN